VKTCLTKSAARISWSRHDAKGLIEELAHGTSFAKLAEMHSMCPSRKNGGDLGQFGRGSMVRAFEKAAFAPEKGQTSAPVKTEFGWHIIRRTE
jgi:peptidyl-prolyl cis-trans isomerase C